MNVTPTRPILSIRQPTVRRSHPRGAISVEAGGQSPLKSRRLSAWTALVVAAGLSWAIPSVAQARAKLVDLHGAVLAGGMTGRGTDSATPDLFHQTEGAGAGLELGARLLVLDFSVRFMQTINSHGAGGTVLSALFGPSVEIPVIGGGEDSSGKERPPQMVIRPSVQGGVCFGTLVPVDPPLTNDQLAGKGFLAVGRFALERMFGPILGVGGEVEGGYHYLVGASGVINGKDHSSGWQMGVFATLAFHLGI